MIHEAIQQMGWPADPTTIVDRVKRLDLGLPAEDEFIYLISWLGKCSLVHKLDQSQYPPRSTDDYQVPDILACFDTEVGKKLVLVEVKSKKNKKLVWKADYLIKLKNYSAITGIPLLIAWKFYGLWLLVDINLFVKARTNFHLSLETAAKNNLMGYLAGDFVYIMSPNVGLHFVMKKEELVSVNRTNENSREEEWKLRIEKAYFTNSAGDQMTNLPKGLWPLLISAEPEPKDRIENDYVYQSFVISENHGMRFAHAALPVLMNLSIKNDYRIHWRKELVNHKYPVEIKQFYDAASEGLKKGFVKYIFHLQPFEFPNFLKDAKNTEQPH